MIHARDAGPEAASPWLFRAVVAAALATGTLLIASALALNLLLSNLAASRALVLRAGGTLQSMAQLHLDVRAAETGQRGYLLTGERRYLVPYDEAVARIWTTYDALAATVAEPAQRERLARLRPLIGAKLDELARTVALRGRSFEEALQVVRTDLGQRLTEEIDAVVGAFEGAEQASLVDGTVQLDRRSAWATRVAALTGLLALATALLGAALLARQRSDMRLFAAERGFRRSLERQVEERTAELSRSNRELDAFAYTVSHDLRAPLRAVHGYAEALVEDHGEALAPEARGFVGRIVAAAERMEGLIQDILAYSRLARAETVSRPVSLERLVDGVLAGLRRAAPGREGRQDPPVRVERPLPDVEAHGPTLAQALENLISNALKFVPAGTGPEVRIAAERRGDRVRLWVEDRGIGVDPAHHDRIFQPFERLHGIETYPGTGIGLAIVRRGLERMGGTCGVEPAPERGSRFWLELPEARRGELDAGSRAGDTTDRGPGAEETTP